MVEDKQIRNRWILNSPWLSPKEPTSFLLGPIQLLKQSKHRIFVGLIKASKEA